MLNFNTEYSNRRVLVFNIISRRYRRKILWTAFVLFMLGLVIITIFSIPPSDFPQKETMSIKPGTYLGIAAQNLAAKHLIRSPFLFKLYAILLSGHRQVLSGDYLFDAPQSALKIAYRTVYGMQDLPRIKITITEGMTVKDINSVIVKNIPEFDQETFLTLAKPYEGYLFPDTYYFYENTTAEQVISTLRDTFNQRIKTVLLKIRALGKPTEDVIKMASIVEKEAIKSEDRKIIAGILWKRLSIGMPLQVDPPFNYILGKGSADLSTKDLAIDSPYNLYKHTGLPPTPIDNPGLDAIDDTVSPTDTPYLFYLSDSKGNMHYAATNDGHVANKQKYIQ